MALVIPCDAKYYFVKLPLLAGAVAADLKDITVEPGPPQKEVRGSFALYQSPVATGSYPIGERFIVNYGDKQDLRTTEFYTSIHQLPFTNMPVEILQTIDISHLVRGTHIEESLRSQGIYFHPQTRRIALVKGLLDDSVYAGPCGYLSESRSFVIRESYRIREYHRDDSRWRLVSDFVVAFQGDSIWRGIGPLPGGMVETGKYRLITPVDRANPQYEPVV